MNTRKSDRWYIFVLMAIVVTFFWPVFWGKVPAPLDALVGLYHPWRDYYSTSYPRGIPYKNFLITDPVRQQIPWKKAVIDQWAQGRIPTWNPYAFSGSTLIGNIQAGVFQPLNVLFLAFPFPIAWITFIVLQLVLAGLFMYLFLKSLKLESVCAVCGSIAWIFSGFMISWLTWGTIDYVVSWLPLGLYSLNRFVHIKKIKIQWAVGWASAIALAWVSGHAQVALYSTGVLILYALFTIVVHKPRKTNLRLILLAAACVLCFIILSPQLVPFVQALTQSGRVLQTDSWLGEGWFIPWQHIVQFVAPDFFGNPATLNYWGQWNYAEFVGYIGIVPFIFALSMLFVKKTKEQIFWVVVFLTAMVFAFPSPLAKLPYALSIPFVSSLQPTRLLALICFSLATLSSYGFEYWKTRDTKPMIKATGVMCIFIVFLWGLVYIHRIPSDPFFASYQIAKRNLILPTLLVAGVLISIVVRTLSDMGTYKHKGVVITILTTCLIIVTAGDLLRFAKKFTPFVDVRYFFPETKITEYLEEQPKPFRIVTLDDRILPPNVSAWYGIESVEGYDPVIPVRYEAFMASTNRNSPDISPPFGFNRIVTVKNIHSPLFDLLGATFVLTFADIQLPEYELVFQEGQTKVYKHLNALPRLYFAQNAIRVQSDQEAFDHMYDPDFVPGKTVIVQDDIDVSQEPIGQEEYARLDVYMGSFLDISVSAASDRLLVISNTYSDMWHVKIDGSPVHIIPVNYIHMGIVVPEGEHTVTVSAQ